MAFCEQCQKPERVDPDGRDEEGVMRYKFRKHPRYVCPVGLEPLPCRGSGQRV